MHVCNAWTLVSFWLSVSRQVWRGRRSRGRLGLEVSEANSLLLLLVLVVLLVL